MKNRIFKLGVTALFGLSLFGLASCDSSSANELVILNWEDYMSDELIEAFEDEYNCTVHQSCVTSSEDMYYNIKNEISTYDIVIPSDYTIMQLKEENLIQKLDYSKLSNYKENIFVPELQALMDSSASSYKDYYIPYFWGSLGIMYNKKVSGLEEAVLENSWACLFDKSVLPAGTRVGMYNTSRDSLAAAELYKGYSLNTKDTDIIKECFDLVNTKNKEGMYSVWGTDDIKLKISQANLDVALVYSGDYFDIWYADDDDNAENHENYGIYAPTENNNVFFDAMVIPNNANNTDLAYKFIDFMLDHENSYTNASWVGYCPTLNSVYTEMKEEEDSMFDICDAYDPAIVVKAAKNNAEVYQFLGSDVYALIEEEFNKIRY